MGLWGTLETVDGRRGLQERAGPSFAKEHLRVRLGPQQGCLPLREEGIQVFNILGPDRSVKICNLCTAYESDQTLEREGRSSLSV